MSVDPQKQFDTDFGGLLDATKEYDAELKEMQDARTYYLNTIIPKLKSIKDVEQIIIYLITAVYQNASPSDPHTDSSIFGMDQDQTGLYGIGLKVNSLLTAVHTDLQNIIDNPDPKYSSDPEQVKNVADDLHQILLHLTTDPNFKEALDPTTLTNMTLTDETLRHMFYINGEPEDPIDNPPAVPAPGSERTYYFEYGGGINYLTSFKEMQDDMKLPGDDKQATEAYQKLTDNLNSDLGMTQTVNSALNEQLNQLTNFVKALMGFYENGLCQPWMKLNNMAIQNQKSG